MEQWMTLIQDIGFRTIVLFYLLHRLVTKVGDLQEVLVSI